MATLLERAKRVKLYRNPRNKRPRREVDSLVLAWITDEISYKQASEALKVTGTSAYGILAVGAKRLYLDGRLPVQKR